LKTITHRALKDHILLEILLSLSIVLWGAPQDVVVEPGPDETENPTCIVN